MRAHNAPRSARTLGAVVLTYRFRATDEYIATMITRHWQQRPLYLRPAVQYTTIALVFVALWMSMSWKGADPRIVGVGAILLGLCVGPGAYWLTKSLIRRRISAHLPNSSETLVTLSDDGVSVQGSMSSHELRWDVFSSGVRFPDGIMLTRPRVICWLPNSALAGAFPRDADAFVSTRIQLRHVA